MKEIKMLARGVLLFLAVLMGGAQPVSAKTYYIDTPEQYLKWLDGICELETADEDEPGVVIKLRNDLVFDGPVGYMKNFEGTFDGCGHTMSGIRQSNDTWVTGLFAFPYKATIKNLTVKDSEFHGGKGRCAAIASGSSYQLLIDNCHIVNCKITGGDVAGIALLCTGQQNEVRNCTTLNCDIKADGGTAAGVFNQNSLAECNVYNCANYSTVSSFPFRNLLISMTAGVTTSSGYEANCVNGVETECYQVASGSDTSNCYYLKQDLEGSVFPADAVASQPNIKALSSLQMQSSGLLEALNAKKKQHKEWLAWEYRKDECPYPLLCRRKEITVQFDANGGVVEKNSKTVETGGNYEELPAAMRSKYQFLGWYTQPKDGKQIEAATAVSEENGTVLYAHWKKISVQKVKKPSLVNKKKKLLVGIRAVSGAKGYQIRYSLKSRMSGAKKVKSAGLSNTIKGLKKGKTYYVQARAYVLDSAGEKVYGSWSAKAKIKIKR